MNKWTVVACVLGGSLLGSSALGGRVVMDTRLSPQPTYAPQEAQVLRDVFGAGQIPSCRDTRVTDRTPGAFTRRGVQQTAYLIHSCGSTRLVIYEGGRIVRTLRNVGDAIGNVGDLNLDGVDDLLFLATYTTGKSNTLQDASFVTLAGGQFRTLFDLPQATVNQCGGAAAYSIAHRVTVEPASRPRLTIEEYEGDCLTGFRRTGSRTALGNP